MGVRRFTALRLIPVALAIFLAACGGGESAPSPTATPVPLVVPSATATPEPDATSPYSLPTREVPFAVSLPAGTSGPVWVRVYGPSQWEIVRSAELTRDSDGTWTGSLPLEEGALVHYAYDRGDLDDFASLTARREAPAVGLETTWRIVQVGPELTEVRDTVAMWADSPGVPSVGSVAGVVTDALSGEPLMDTEVSIAGMHTATDFAGRYRFENVSAGDQIVTVHRATGDHLAASSAVAVAAGEEATLAFAVEPARPMRVQLEAVLPDDMPADAAVKVYGNAWQLGGHYYTAPGQPDGLRLPVGRTVQTDEGNKAYIALDLYEGQAVSYRYTLAGPGLSSEIRLDGDQAPRSFIVGENTRQRVDTIDAFRPDGAVEVVLRADVPANTPEDTPIQFVMGPGHWMTPTDDGEWSTVLYGRPGEVLTYALRLGDGVGVGADASSEASGGSRFLEIPEGDTASEVRVTDWVGLRGVAVLADGELSEVTFRVSVPVDSISSNSVLRIIGDRGLEEGVPLTRVAGNPTLFEGSAMLPEGRYTYTVALANEGEDEQTSRDERKLEVSLAEQTVNDWVSSWTLQLPTVAARDARFHGGYYLPDYWSPGFEALSAPTFDNLEGRIEDLDGNGVSVALSSVWSYGRVRPEPVVEPRSLLASSVATPLEALQEQASAARRSDLPIVLAPQLNMELTSDGGSLAGAKSQQWLDAWLAEAERVWLWNAEVAEAINADVLLLPGPTFHVFDSQSSFPSQQSFEAFDEALVRLMGEVRERYSGQLLVSGGETSMDAPGAADLVGATTFDTGHPALEPSATVAQWKAGYEALFAARLDPIHDAWGLPVVFYQLEAPSVASAGDPTGEYAQARQLEGMLQALESRTWVVGALSWSYEMIDAPEVVTSGVRGRIAEAVLSKYFELFNADDIEESVTG